MHMRYRCSFSGTLLSKMEYLIHIKKKYAIRTLGKFWHWISSNLTASLQVHDIFLFGQMTNWLFSFPWSPFRITMELTINYTRNQYLSLSLSLSLSLCVCVCIGSNDESRTFDDESISSLKEYGSDFFLWASRLSVIRIWYMYYIIRYWRPPDGSLNF